MSSWPHEPYHSFQERSFEATIISVYRGFGPERWSGRQGFKHRGPCRRELSEKTLRSPDSPFGHRRGCIGCSAAVPLRWPVPVAQSRPGVGLAWLSQFASRFCAAAAAASCNAMTSTVGRLEEKWKKDTMPLFTSTMARPFCVFAASERSRLAVPASTILTRSTVAATIGGYSQTPQADRR